MNGLEALSPSRGLAWVSGALSVARRELLSLFVTPLAYVVGTLFLLNQGWNFALLLRFLNDPLAAPGPVMQFYFGGSFFIFWLPVLFICSTISMRLLAEERRAGTLEALLTSPLRPSQIVLGKFLGALGFYALLWLPTVVFYLLLDSAAAQSPGSAPELGPILSGYLGTFLTGASFLSVGLLASSRAKSQLGAALLTFVSCTIVLLAGLLVDQVDSVRLSGALQWSSLLSMMQEMAQGIVDGHWIWLHAAVVFGSLFWATVLIDPRRDAQSIAQGVLVTIAVAALALFAGRHAQRQDWTRGKVYTLSDRAETVLADLRGPIDVTVIIPGNIGGARQNPLLAEVREVLVRMARVSPALRLRFLDPDRDRQEAQQLIVDFGLHGRELAEGVILVRAGQGPNLRRTHVLPGDLVTMATGAEVQANGPRVKAFRGEEALLRRFLEVSEPLKSTVCYTQGHGEPAFDNLEPYAGYAHLRDLIRSANLELRQADLGSGAENSTDLSQCDVLLVAGPQGPLSPEEVDNVEAHIEAGGDLLMLAGATVLRERAGLAPHGLEPLLASRGIRFGQRVVLDPSTMAGGSPLLAYTLSTTWGDHEAVRSLIMRPVSMVQSRELWVESTSIPGLLGESKVGNGVAVLLSTTDDGWAESDLEGIKRGQVPTYDDAQDRAGPIPIAAAVESGDARIVVIASDQFALNALLREDVAYDHGRDLILNSLGWLTKREELLGIRPREREHVKLVLQEAQLRRMTWMCLVGLPGFAIGLGLIVLWRRRR